MTLSRLLTPVALAAFIALGLSAPADAQAGAVSVKIAPVKVGVKLGPVTIGGVIGGGRAPAAQPGPRAIWIPAHTLWDPARRRTIYVAGAYKVPPRAGMHYVVGHWVGRGHSRRWSTGHWV